MDAVRISIDVSPHNLFLAIHFDQFWRVFVFASACIAGDHNVPIWQDLTATGILQPRSWKVIVGQFPDDPAVLIELHNAV